MQMTIKAELFKSVGSGLFTLLLLGFVAFHMITLFILLLNFEFIYELDSRQIGSVLLVYNECIYFIVTTLTTVGYGDLKPIKTNPELLTIGLEFVGLILYGYATQKVRYIIEKSQVEANAKESRVSILKFEEKIYYYLKYGPFSIF